MIPVIVLTIICTALVARVLYLQKRNAQMLLGLQELMSHNKETWKSLKSYQLILRDFASTMKPIVKQLEREKTLGAAECFKRLDELEIRFRTMDNEIESVNHV
jgi:hypothetical protein